MESRSCARSSTGTANLRDAARSENSRSSVLLEQLRIELAGPHRHLDRRLRGIERDQAAVDRLDDLVEQARALRLPCAAGGAAGWRAAAPARPDPTAPPAHRRCRSRSSRRASSRRAAPKARSPRPAAGRASTARPPRRADTPPRAPPPRPWRGGAPAPGRRRASASSTRQRCRRGRHDRRTRRAVARCIAGSTSARSSCWPWISTSARPMSRISDTLAGWSLTKTRVRPSAVCTRFRMMSPSSSMALSARSARAGWLRGTSKAAVTWPLRCAVADQRRVAARAERERQRIEQDGFAGAGLAGQHRKAGAKVDLQPFDQDDIADRQMRQHVPRARPEPAADAKASAGSCRPWRATSPRSRAAPGRRFAAARRNPCTTGCPDSCCRAPRRPSAPRR